ncbi:MAG: hypothetical protein JWL95_1156 [Gemmatimonadetes bacterium]|nr:hypothetical protein [Gemmatimonadota bacterium]
MPRKPSTTAFAPAAPSPAPSPRFPGVSIELGGRVFVVPPLSLASLRSLHEKLDGIVLDEIPDLSKTVDLLEVALAALQRNYPELTISELADLVDVSTFGPLMLAAMGRT